MRFLADENFPVPSIRRLRAAYHDVAAIIEDSPGVEDTVVLARAVSEGRYLLTLDRDYGELIFRRGFAPHRDCCISVLSPVILVSQRSGCFNS